PRSCARSAIAWTSGRNRRSRNRLQRRPMPKARPRRPRLASPWKLLRKLLPTLRRPMASALRLWRQTPSLSKTQRSSPRRNRQRRKPALLDRVRQSRRPQPNLCYRALNLSALKPHLHRLKRSPRRPPGERRPRDAERRGSRRRHHERPATPAEGQPAGEGAPAGTDGQAVAADATPPVEGERKERHGRPRHRRRDRGPRKDADSKSAEGPTIEARSNENKAGEEQRADRPQKQGRPERRPER